VYNDLTVTLRYEGFRINVVAFHETTKHEEGRRDAGRRSQYTKVVR
jgi:hypothetical protein